MKKRNFGIVAAAALIMCGMVMHGCKEVGPVLPWGNTFALSDTTYTETPQNPETKNVLIEMFTGVSCINCPQGDAVLAGLISADTPRVIGIAMHSSNEPTAQDEQLADSRQNLECPEALAIVNQFVDVGSRPMGAVDRILQNPSTLTGSPSIYDDRSTWGATTTTELAKVTPVNVVLAVNYTPASQSVLVSVTLHYNSAAAPDSNKLSVFLTEDSIVTAQLNGSANDTNFVHNWVLRKALSNALGDLLNVNAAPGLVTRIVYQYTIPSGTVWNPAHMHVVAFVQKYLNGRNDILQTKIAPLE